MYGSEQQYDLLKGAIKSTALFYQGEAQHLDILGESDGSRPHYERLRDISSPLHL
jgi:hypothetical protein